jgi:hypothetical protein
MTDIFIVVHGFYRTGCRRFECAYNRILTSTTSTPLRAAVPKILVKRLHPRTSDTHPREKLEGSILSVCICAVVVSGRGSRYSVANIEYAGGDSSQRLTGSGGGHQCPPPRSCASIRTTTWRWEEVCERRRIMQKSERREGMGCVPRIWAMIMSVCRQPIPGVGFSTQLPATSYSQIHPNSAYLPHLGVDRDCVQLGDPQDRLLCGSISLGGREE